MDKQISTIERLDRERAIAYIQKIIAKELEEKDLSEQALGWRMGRLSQATINKLRLGKFNNIPNFDTMEAIAIYFGLTLSQFLAKLEEECPSEIPPQDNWDLVSSLYQIDDLKLLAEIAKTATAILQLKISQKLL